MVGYFVLGMLAAFGALCVLWTVFGWLLPEPEGCAVVCWNAGVPESLSRLAWLRNMGFLNCPVIVVSDGAVPDMDTCSEEELLLRLKQLCDRYYGTGNGDHSGRGQRRDLSEL